MVVGLVLRGLRGWLHEHVGLDIENSAYTVEYPGGHSHVVVRLQDVALTQALWSFIVGPILPLTTHSGQVREVTVEISTEAVIVEVRDVVLRLRKVELSEIVREANLNRARALRDRDKLLSGAVSQSELKRWVKGKIKVSVASLVVLLDDDGPEGSGLLSLAVFCQSVKVGDPDDPSMVTEECGVQPPAAPFHRAGRDALYQMAKDVTVTEVRVFFRVGVKPRHDNPQDACAWCSEDAVCPAFHLGVAYRAWDPGGLALLPSVANEAKKTMLLQVLPVKVRSNPDTPFVVALKACEFSFLMSFLGNMDSLYFAWSTVLQESTQDIEMKPLDSEVARYMELWRQYRASPAFGYSRELHDMEWRFGGSYTARMRNLSQQAATPSRREHRCFAAPGHSRGSSIDTAEQICLLGSEVLHPERAEVSPRIPPQVLERSFSLEAGTEDGREPDSSTAATVNSSATTIPKEFLVGSAFRVVLPAIVVKIDLQDPGPDVLPSTLSTLSIGLPSLCLNYVRDLDNRQVTLESSCLQLDVSCPSPARSRLAEEPPTARKALLNWNTLRVAVDYFGENHREILVGGEITLEFPTIWPHLQTFPGVRPVVDYPKVIRRWYPGEELPEGLAELLAPTLGSRHTAYVFDVPSLCITHLPSTKELPPVELQLSRLSGRFGPSGASDLRLAKACVRTRGLVLGELPVCTINDLEVVRRLVHAADGPLQVILPHLEVDLTPYLIHVLAKHWRSYDPRSTDAAAGAHQTAPEKSSGVPRLPDAALEARHVVVKLWHEADAGYQGSRTEARLQVRLHGLQIDSAGASGASRQQGSTAAASLQVQVAGLLGDAESGEDGRCVFLCTHLNGGVGAPKAALSVDVSWKESHTELGVGACFLHLAPTAELVQNVQLLVPGVLGGKANPHAVPALGGGSGSPFASSALDLPASSSGKASGQAHGGAATTEVTEKSVGGHASGLGDQGGVAAAAGRSGPVCTHVLRLGDVSVGVHFSSSGREPVLLGTCESEPRCSVAVGSHLGAYVGVQKLHMRAWTGDDGRCVEASAGCAHIGVVRRHVRRDAASLAEQTAADGLKGVKLVWIAMLQDVTGTVALPGTGSLAAPRVGALRVQSASLWASTPRGPRQGLPLEQVKRLCSMCPFVPREHASEHLRLLLLSSRGAEPWIVLTLNGASVSGCREPGPAEGFYATQAFLKDGHLVFRKADGDLWLTRASAGKWKIFDGRLPDLPAGVVWSCSEFAKGLGAAGDSGQAAGTVAAALGGGPAQTYGVALLRDASSFLVQLRVTPTSLVIPEVDLSPIVMLPRHIRDFLSRLRQPASSKSKSSLSRVPSSVSEVGHEPSRGSVWWQVFVSAEFSVLLEDRPSSPELRLRCRPQPGFTGSQSVCELRELSIELLEGGHAHVSICLNGIHVLRPPQAPELEFVVSVASILGRQTREERHGVFIRKFETNTHVGLKFSPGKELYLYLAPTAVRMHRDWTQPLATFLNGLSSLYSLSNFRESRAASANLGLAQDTLDDDHVLWEGPLWELATESGSVTSAEARRRCLQVTTDGFVKDTQEPMRERVLKIWQAWTSTLFGSGFHAVDVDTLEAFNFAFDTQGDAALLHQIVSSARPPQEHNNPTLSLPAPTTSGLSKQRSDIPSGTDPSSVGRSSVAAVTRHVAARMTNTLQWIATGPSHLASAIPSPRPLPSSPSISTTSTSLLSRTESGMHLDVEVKSIEFWLPTDAEDNGREVGFLLAAEAQGMVGNEIVAKMTHFVAMHLSPACWSGVGCESTLPSQELVDTGAMLEASFESITRWNPTEGVGGSLPGSPGGPTTVQSTPRDVRTASTARARYTPLWHAVLGDAQTQGMAWPASKLMEASGLTLVMLWGPQPTAGVRLEGVDVRVPAELLQCWPVMRGHVGAFTGDGKKRSPAPDDASEGLSSARFSSEQPLVQRDSSSTEVRGDPVHRPQGCDYPPSSQHHDASTLSSGRYTSEVQLSGAAADADAGGTVWKFEFDVASQIDVTLCGGLLAPAHWLHARFSDIMMHGFLPLQEGHPLGGLLKCEVRCYDAQAAQLEPVLEPVEVTVDVSRWTAWGGGSECCLSMARVNLNVHRVLVDFLETVRCKLQSTRGVSLKPLQTCKVRNESGVKMVLQGSGASDSRELINGGEAVVPRLDGRGAKLSFFSEPPLEMEDDVMIDLDYKHGRAYLLRASRCVVFVEPRHEVQGDGQCTCTLHVRSAVSVHNNTAVPMHIFLNYTSTAIGRTSTQLLTALVPGQLEGSLGHLEIQAYSKAKCLPLNWFTSRGQMTHIKPADGDIPPRCFSQLASLLEGELPDDDSMDEPLPKPSWSAERQLRERMKFNLFFHTYLKLIGYVNAHDVPMTEVEDMRPAQRYELHLDNVLSFRNRLPFPVIMQLCAKGGVLQKHDFPAAEIRRALRGGPLPPSSDDAVSPLDNLEEAAAPCSVRCFSLEKGELQSQTELENILRLTMGRMRHGSASSGSAVASYVLGIDQELTLPFAKRSLHVRLLALAEDTDSSSSSTDELAQWLLVSMPQRVFLPPAQSEHLGIVLWQCRVGGPLPQSDWPASCCTAEPGPELGGAKSLQVGLELTRNSVVLFAPLMLENLTPFPMRIHPEDSTYMLRPWRRRVLPRVQQLRDAVYFAFQTDEREGTVKSKAQGQEITGVSSGGPLERLPPLPLPPLPAPGDTDDPGMLLDGLSLGICVRRSTAPLRLTNIVSIVPRFYVLSELEEAVTVHFSGFPECRGCVLSPHQRGTPVHPPSRSYATEGGPRLCLTQGPWTSNPFPIERTRKDDSEHKRNFHVRMERTAQRHSSEPSFIQVAIHPAVFPDEGHVHYMDCYFIVLHPRDFSGSEDELFHLANYAPLTFFAIVVSTVQCMDTDQRAVLVSPTGSDGHPSHQWVHRVGARDTPKDQQHQRHHPALEIYQDPQCQKLLKSVDLEKVSEFRPNAVVAGFCLEAKIDQWSVRESIPGRLIVSGLVTLGSDVGGFSVEAELSVQNLGRRGRACLHVVRVGRISASPKEAEAVRVVFRKSWCLTKIGSSAPEPGNAWRRQLLQAASEKPTLKLEVGVEVRHFRGADGVHHFMLQSTADSSAAAAAAGSSKLQLKVAVPVLSVSWISNGVEVLAARMKGLDFQLTRTRNSDERNDDCALQLSAQHLQVDHFVEGELPVVLNRRFLHINSRLLGKKAFFFSIHWVLGTRNIHLLRLDMVPYWLNLEIGVLIRLWDQAEGSFSSMCQRDESNKSVPLGEPQLPCSAMEQSSQTVWRLVKLVIEPLKVTIMVRSPDPASLRDNPRARWIMRLPTDMPNMDLMLPKIDEHILGSTQQLLGWLSHKYVRKVKFSALWSIFLSYLGAIVKGILNALWWLARGPYDAVNVAHETRLEIPQKDVPWLWWVSPAVHGVAEGTYRAMAELLGNSIFGVVLILNAFRQIILNTTRPRAHNVLDGLLYGFRGLVLDALLTPVQQLLTQTQTAYQDWGVFMAIIVFFLSLVRIPLGPVLGATHFIAAACEGCVNILLHEEAQFAAFEPQRIVEGTSLSPSIDVRETLLGAHERRTLGAMLNQHDAPGDDRPSQAPLPRRWPLFSRQFQLVKRAIADDDEVMGTFETSLHHALRP